MRIWFNHWFSTSYHLINMMRAKEPERFTFIGSSKNPYAIYKQACSEFYTENHNVSEEEYVDFCLDFCKEHKVDIFVPRHNIVPIIRNAERFTELGVKLFAEQNAEMVDVLEDKFKTYQLLRDVVPDRIPEIRLASSLEEFEAAVAELKKNHSRACYKLAIDEGASSFRVVDDSIEGIGALKNKPGNKITMRAALKILGEYDFSVPMIVMPYLGDVEISVDCLKTNRGDLIITLFRSHLR